LKLTPCNRNIEAKWALLPEEELLVGMDGSLDVSDGGVKAVEKTRIVAYAWN